MKTYYVSIIILLFLCPLNLKPQIIRELEKGFSTPPDTEKPGVYWYFLDGNINRESLTKDIESMKQAGIGNLMYLEVNVGVPIKIVA